MEMMGNLKCINYCEEYMPMRDYFTCISEDIHTQVVVVVDLYFAYIPIQSLEQ